MRNVKTSAGIICVAELTIFDSGTGGEITEGADGRRLWLELRHGAIVWPAIGFRMGDAEAAGLVDVVYSVTPDHRADSLRLLLHDLRPSG